LCDRYDQVGLSSCVIVTIRRALRSCVIVTIRWVLRSCVIVTIRWALGPRVIALSLRVKEFPVPQGMIYLDENIILLYLSSDIFG
jgi:hypothetical protein